MLRDAMFIDLSELGSFHQNVKTHGRCLPGKNASIGSLFEGKY